MRLVYALCLLMFASSAAAQQQPVVSLDHYVERIYQLDLLAAQYRYERDQLRQQVQGLKEELSKLKNHPPEPPRRVNQ